MPRTTFEKTSLQITRGTVSCSLIFILATLLLVPAALAADKAKDEETLRNANLVLQDMLNGNTISPRTSMKPSSCATWTGRSRSSEPSGVSSG